MGAALSSVLPHFEKGVWQAKLFPTESLAMGNTVNEALNKAIKDGNSQSFHSQVQILGNAKAGKTSTFKTLTNQAFRSDEQSTEGAKSYNVRPQLVTTNLATVNWRIETTHSSNFIRQLIAAAAAAINEGGRFQIFVMTLVFFVTLLAITTVNYVWKNSFYTSLVVVIMPYVFFHENRDMIGRLILPLCTLVFIINVLIVLLPIYEFSLLGSLYAAFLSGILLGAFFITNLAPGLLISLTAYGVGGGNVLNCQSSFLRDPKSYVKAAVGILVGSALGLLLGSLARFIRNRATGRLPFVLSLFPAVLLPAICHGCFLLISYETVLQAEKNVVALFGDDADGLPVFLFWVFVGALTASGIRIGVLLASSKGKKSLFADFVKRSFSIQCLKIEFQAHKMLDFLCGMVLAGAFVKISNFEQICPSSLGLNGSYVYNFLASLMGSMLEMSYWNKLNQKELNFNFLLATQNAINKNEKILSGLVKTMEDGKEGLQNIQQPLLKIIDFGGEKLYYAMHHVFLKPKSVFVIVFNFETFDKGEKDNLIGWVKRAYFYGGSGSKAFLVGTHRDLCPEERRERIVSEVYEALKDTDLFRRDFVYREKDNRQLLVFQIENSKSRDDSSVIKLRSQIDQHVAILRDPRAEVDNACFELEDVIADLREKETNRPIITVDELESKTRAQTCFKKLDLKRCLKYLQKSGVVLDASSGCPYAPKSLHWNELKNYVIINPQFLAEVMKYLLHDFEEYKSAFISNQDLQEKLSKCFPCDNTQILLKFLEHYGFVVSTSNEWAIIAWLPSSANSSWKKLVCNRPHFYFHLKKAGGIHFNVFHVLLIRIRKSSEGNNYTPTLHQQSGKFIFHSSDDLDDILYRIECHPTHEIFKVTVKRGRKEQLHKLLKHLVDLLVEITKSFPEVEFLAGTLCPLGSSCQEGKKQNSRFCSPLGHMFPLLESGRDLGQQRNEYLRVHCGDRHLKQNDKALTPNFEMWLSPAQTKLPSEKMSEDVFPADSEVISKNLTIACSIAGEAKWESLAACLVDLTEIAQIKEQISANRVRLQFAIDSWKTKGPQQTVGELMKWFEETGVSRRTVKKQYSKMFA